MDAWQPDQYDRFLAERRLPFDELVGLLLPTDGGVVYDVGCGNGNRTVDLADALNARIVIGTDTSPAMLEAAAEHASDRVRFERGDLAAFRPEEPPNVIVSNAALHWVTDHDAVLAQWRSHLPAGGQLAVQVPANFDHPTQRLASAVADRHADWFEDGTPPALISSSSLAPERYAEILHQLGAVEQKVMLRVYPHVLDTTLDAVEWMKGTTLTAYEKALIDHANYATLLAEVEAAVLDHYGEQAPFLYTFKRILFWARF